MYMIGYISAATNLMSDGDVQRIIDKSVEFNGKNGLTGALMFCNGSFLQFLEGERDAVLSLYEKISADPRHEKLKLIYQKDVSERAFGNWSMALCYDRDCKLEERAIIKDMIDVYNDKVQKTSDFNHVNIKVIMDIFRKYITQH